MNSAGKIIAISISNKKGIQKTNVESARIIAGFGIEGDAHAGKWHRQISLLSVESIEKVKNAGLTEILPGNFAENITTSGFDLLSLKVGEIITLGESRLEITQIGKECHNRCAIFEAAGDCIMPREGIFAKVLSGGNIKINDEIRKKEN